MIHNKKQPHQSSTTINKKNLLKIRNNIIKLSPHPKKVKIIAVTKNHPFTSIQSAIKNRIITIGENRIQETTKKLLNKKLENNIEIHLIGHLQSNKVARAVEIYNVIQSVDSLKVLHKINLCAKEKNKVQKIFLQTYTTPKQTQFGIQEKEIHKVAKEAKKLKNIQNIGIMAIGAHTKKQKKIEESFQKAQKIKEEIQNKIDHNCSYLSIGMSQDYKIALQCGATHLRLGTILFQ